MPWPFPAWLSKGVALQNPADAAFWRGVAARGSCKQLPAKLFRPGYEHTFVLSGSQEDDHGVFNAGTVVINAPGTRHKERSGAGCILLAIYEKPVRFLEVSE